MGTIVASARVGEGVKLGMRVSTFSANKVVVAVGIFCVDVAVTEIVVALGMGCVGGMA